MPTVRVRREKDKSRDSGLRAEKGLEKGEGREETEEGQRRVMGKKNEREVRPERSWQTCIVRRSSKDGRLRGGRTHKREGVG